MGFHSLSCTDSFGACTSGVIAYTVISTTNVCVNAFLYLATVDLISIPIRFTTAASSSMMSLRLAFALERLWPLVTFAEERLFTRYACKTREDRLNQ